MPAAKSVAPDWPEMGIDLSFDGRWCRAPFHQGLDANIADPKFLLREWPGFAYPRGHDITTDGGASVVWSPLSWQVAVGVHGLGGTVLLVPPTDTMPFISCRRAASAVVSPPSAIDTPSTHADVVRWMKAVTGLSSERIGRLLGVSRMTLNLWDRGQQISNENRQRLLAVREVLQRASRRHRDPGELALWLDTPRGSAGTTPAQLLEAGQINRARYFAAAVPSARVARPPEWSSQTVSETFSGATLNPAVPEEDDAEMEALRTEAEILDEPEPEES